MQYILHAFLLLATTLTDVAGANILALLPTPTPSHHIWNRSLMLRLASRGHTVTVVSPEAEKSPVTNYTDIVIDGLYQAAQRSRNYMAMNEKDRIREFLTLFSWGPLLCEYGLSTDGVQSLIKSKNNSYDLIIVEVTLYDCYLGFIHKFGYPPVIAITAFSSPIWGSFVVGNPLTPSYIPNMFLPFSDHMSFEERMINFLLYSGTKLYRKFVQIPRLNAIARKHFGEAMPSISEIESHISIVMDNTHHSMDYPRPLLPAMIPIGGMHITPSKTLPKDLQTYLDEAKDGVIYFSLGSNVRSDQMGADKITALLAAFRELPQRVLWKWESDSLPGQPDNVMLGKWLPQNDILGHPNVRLFITHAGLLSTQEAIYHGVPIVGVPFFGDQLGNVQKAVVHGVGEELEYKELSKELVLKTIRKVINNRSYRVNMARLSAIFRDQPQPPLERAVFWTEYVIRHRGAPHLRSAANDVTWYQYLLLDVIGALVLAAMTSLLLVWLTISTVIGVVKRKVYRQSDDKIKLN